MTAFVYYYKRIMLLANYQSERDFLELKHSEFFRYAVNELEFNINEAHDSGQLTSYQRKKLMDILAKEM